MTEKAPGTAVATAIANAAVAASSLSLAGIPVVVSQGEVANDVSVGHFTDNLSGTSANQYAATIDWGDGSTSAGVVVASAAGNGFTVTGSHSYNGAGTRNMQVIVHGPAGATSQVATTSTVGSATELFVSQVYRDLLNREPETQGLEYWANRIDGGNSRTTEVLNIEHTHEYRLDTIQGLFREYLLRDADPAALAADEAFLINGGITEQLAAELVGSSEYFHGRGGSANQGFLNALYGDALLRSAAQNDVAFFSGQDFGAEAARRRAADIVFGSGEYYRDLVSMSGSAGSSRFNGWIAYGWYQAFLNREPDNDSKAFFASALAGGPHDDVVIAEIVASQEYFSLWQTRTDPMQP